ncbi:PP2C family serine/threonine-protein phosphatase [Estrella lausannensis]|uniref:Serine/threonine PP2C protein phosphatase n=1 Tax=Estrella lausannensis TaxID=483423 RepID=A0A0H5E7T1_9BACT|nr:PP2C family protein-serine/threonine phosphatase [Estrella lausannensis]CRX39400.1 serine/threonine PP2C protein phosphatase [Estrella lausannensis]
MKEIFLNNEVSLVDIKPRAGEASEYKPAIEARNGRKYVKWSYEKEVAGLARALRIIQAIALTVFTLFLGLLSNDIRLLWSEGVSGREVVLVFNPLARKTERDEIDLALPKRAAEQGASLPAAVSDDFRAGAFAMETHERTMAGEEDELPDMVCLEGDEELNHMGERGGDPLFFSFEERSATISPLEVLKAQRKEIHQELRKPIPSPLNESITSFLGNCLVLYGDKPHWAEFKKSWLSYQLLTEHDSDRVSKTWHLVNYFYEASSLLKDFKVTTDVDRVRTKILAPVELDMNALAGYVRTPVPTSPGPIDKCSLFLDSFKTAIYSAKGERYTMENQYLAKLLTIERPEGAIEVPCFAVFDGHCDERCSLFLKNRLAGFITAELKASPLLDDLNITNALKLAFVKANAEFKKEYYLSGSTAVVALLIKGALWVANTGSSRAVLSEGGVARQLSQDAKPTNEEFKKGIFSRGGWMIYGRVNGKLAIARSFGVQGELGVTARPKIRKIDIEPDERMSRYLILACDGLFDVVSSIQAASQAEGLTDPADVAEVLFHLAFQRGTRDNVTVMVAKLS